MWLGQRAAGDGQEAAVELRWAVRKRDVVPGLDSNWAMKELDEDTEGATVHEVYQRAAVSGA